MLIIYTNKNIESDTLIDKAIKEYCILFSEPFFDYVIVRKNDEKPYIIPQKLFFNLSHSNAYTVCAVSKSEIGIDIQYHDKKVDITAIGKKFLNLEFSDGKAFFDYFAKAEASSKLEGNALCNKLHIEDNGGRIIPFCSDYSLAVNGEDTSLYLMELYE